MADGKIAAIGAGLSGDVVFDADGCLVFPGFIDAHTHLEMPVAGTVTADDFPSGTRAALAGGTTTILDFATQERDGGTLREALSLWHSRADGRCACDYGFHMALTRWDGATEKELPAVVGEGVTSFKVYMAYDALRLNDREIYEILLRAGELGALVGAHCENGDLVSALTARCRAAGNLAPRYHAIARPALVEAEAVNRFLAIAALAGVPVQIVHLSTAAGLDAFRRARAAGQRVFAETCPQYLTLDESLYDAPPSEAVKYVCSPPLRGREDQRELWEALRAGEIDTISTDHCSFNSKGQKDMGLADFSKIPNGLPGIEHRPALIYTAGVAAGRITPEQMMRLLSEHQARRFGMYPRKGALTPGSDADVVLWDPGYRGVIRAETQLQNVDYTPWEGMEIQGCARAVFLRGELAAKEGRGLRPAGGRYVRRGLPQLG
jgi:dihydropyrimidinase